MSAKKIAKYVTVALLVLGWSLSSADTCRDIKPNALGTYAVRFPDQIGDLQLHEQVQDDDPRLGYITTYRSDGVRLDVYIYTWGVENIPDGVDSDVLRSHYDEVKAHVTESGTYSKITLQSERQTSFGSGAIPALEAHFQLQARDTTLLSFLYLTAKYGGFIKVRLSLQVEKRAEMMTVVNAVRSAMGEIFCASASTVAGDNTAILAAIDRMLGASTVSEAAREIPEIIEYAAFESVSVQVVINENFIEFTDNIDVDSFFMAFFIAGAIKYDLEHPAKFDDPAADSLSAIRAMITGLRIYKATHPSVEHPFVERLARLDESGGLEAFVRSRQ